MHYSKLVYEIKKFITEYLTAELSLETLAEHANYSPYHFHRLFQSSTGEAPMEYVRRLRLRYASWDLVLMNLTIIEIASKYRFESQDGFCRAFKRYYGITPGEYRKLNSKIQSHSHKKIEEVETNMYDINIYEKLVCSRDDKKEALETLDKLLKLSEKSRQFGLLSLEPEIETVQPELFKKSIQMLIDGIEPESLKEILMNYALCGGYKGKELLISILIIEGTLAIQQGVNTLILREKLSSYFGDDFINEIQKHFGLDRESQHKKIDTFISKCQDKPFTSKETSLLEEPLERLDNRSLQRLLREFDRATLVIAITGVSSKIQSKVLKNVSLKLATAIIDDIETMKNIDVNEIEDAQKRILETMNLLRNQGEIVI